MESASVNPIWAYLAASVLGAIGMTAAVLAPYASPPSPGRLAGVLFAAPASLNAIAGADEFAEIVESRFGGRLVYVVYRDPLFPEKMASLGAAYSFDAVTAGCHGYEAPLTLSRLQLPREKRN